MRGHEDGLSLIEVLAAAVLISIAIVPMLALYPNTLGISRETEYDVILSAAAVRKMEEVITLHRAAVPSKKFYLHQEVSGVVGNWLAKDAVPPEVVQNTTTLKGAFAQTAGTFVLFSPGTTNSTTGTPGSTPQGFGWWSDAPLIKTFRAGTWSFRLRRSAGATNGSTARFHVRVYRVPQNTSTAGAVELFSATGPNFTYRTTAATTTWTTVSVGPFTLTNEYLLMEIWLEAVTTSTSHTVTLRVEGSELGDTARSQFTTTPGPPRPTSGTAACTDLPNCRLVWTIATERSSATSGVGRRDTLRVVACRDANGNGACNTGERQVRYDAKITTRP